jgi:hypothetical protein
VFFFDEAHLLFSDAKKALRDKVEQVVKLIRSKGVGVYFISQQPSDLPDPVLAQLSNRVQHALRAYTPAEQKAIKTAAATFRVNPNFNTEEVLSELGTGEALVSFLDAKGRPSIVERCTILPPQSMMGMIDDERRKSEIMADTLYGKYDDAVDNESAYEILTGKAQEEAEQKAEAEREEAEQKERERQEKEEAKAKEKAEKEEAKAKEKAEKEAAKKKANRKKKTSSALGKVANSTMNSIGREVGKSLFRGLLGTLKKIF